VERASVFVVFLEFPMQLASSGRLSATDASSVVVDSMSVDELAGAKTTRRLGISFEGLTRRCML